MMQGYDRLQLRSPEQDLEPFHRPLEIQFFNPNWLTTRTKTELEDAKSISPYKYSPYSLCCNKLLSISPWAGIKVCRALFLSEGSNSILPFTASRSCLHPWIMPTSTSSYNLTYSLPGVRKWASLYGQILPTAVCQVYIKTCNIQVNIHQAN